MADEPNEFSAPGLDLIDTPPSPIRGALAIAICSGVAIGLLASIVFSVDIYAVASARVQPTGRSKIVQASTSGRVAALNVSNGSVVEAGQVLVELDPTETHADQSLVASELQVREAEIARRDAGVRTAREMAQGVVQIPVFSARASADILAREREVLQADLNQLRTGLDALAGRIAETEENKNGLVKAVDSDRNLVRLLQEQVRIKLELEAKGLETKVSLLGAQGDLEKAKAVQTSHESEIGKSDAAIASLRAQQRDLVAKFVSEYSRGRSQAMEKRDELAKNLIKATDKVDRTRLQAPISGTVQELALTTPGQVISGGEQLMVIVPGDAALEVEALVSNKDIGFIKMEQEVRVKLDAFPYTKYGVLFGHVARISHDAVDMGSGAKAANAGADRADPMKLGASPVPQVANLVYPVTITLEKDSIRVGDTDARISAGMTATIEIKTGNRRVIEYILSPLTRVVSTAAHER